MLYYCYYIGFQKEGKIYPWGPCDMSGIMRPLLCRNQNTKSELFSHYFDYIPKTMFSKELQEQFPYYDNDLKYLYEKNLPHLNPLKEGYFLIDEVAMYENEKLDDFSTVLTPATYAAKVDQCLKYGVNTIIIRDEFDNDITPPDISEYRYYAYLDTQSVGYEALLLRTYLSNWINNYDETVIIAIEDV